MWQQDQHRRQIKEHEDGFSLPYHTSCIYPDALIHGTILFSLISIWHPTLQSKPLPFLMSRTTPTVPTTSARVQAEQFSNVNPNILPNNAFQAPHHSSFVSPKVSGPTHSITASFVFPFTSPYRFLILFPAIPLTFLQCSHPIHAHFPVIQRLEIYPSVPSPHHSLLSFPTSASTTSARVLAGSLSSYILSNASPSKALTYFQVNTSDCSPFCFTFTNPFRFSVLPCHVSCVVSNTLIQFAPNSQSFLLGSQSSVSSHHHFLLSRSTSRFNRICKGLGRPIRKCQPKHSPYQTTPSKPTLFSICAFHKFFRSTHPITAHLFFPCKFPRALHVSLFPLPSSLFLVFLQCSHSTPIQSSTFTGSTPSLLHVCKGYVRVSSPPKKKQQLPSLCSFLPGQNTGDFSYCFSDSTLLYGISAGPLAGLISFGDLLG